MYPEVEACNCIEDFQRGYKSNSLPRLRYRSDQPWKPYYPSEFLLLKIKQLIDESKPQKVFYNALADESIIRLLVNSKIPEISVSDWEDCWGRSANSYALEDGFEVKRDPSQDWMNGIVNFYLEGRPFCELDIIVCDHLFEYVYAYFSGGSYSPPKYVVLVGDMMAFMEKISGFTWDVFDNFSIGKRIAEKITTTSYNQKD